MKLVYRNHSMGSRAVLVYELTPDVFLIKTACETINYLINKSTFELMCCVENRKVYFHKTHNDEPTLVICTQNGERINRTLFLKFFKDQLLNENKSDLPLKNVKIRNHEICSLRGLPGNTHDFRVSNCYLEIVAELGFTSSGGKYNKEYYRVNHTFKTKNGKTNPYFINSDLDTVKQQWYDYIKPFAKLLNLPNVCLTFGNKRYPTILEDIM